MSEKVLIAPLNKVEAVQEGKKRKFFRVKIGGLWFTIWESMFQVYEIKVIMERRFKGDVMVLYEINQSKTSPGKTYFNVVRVHLCK